MAWWISFVTMDGGLLDNAKQGVSARQSCVANDLLNLHCRDGIVSLSKMTVVNVIAGVIGWKHCGNANCVGGNEHTQKRWLSIVQIIYCLMINIWMKD